MFAGLIDLQPEHGRVSLLQFVPGPSPQNLDGFGRFAAKRPGLDDEIDLVELAGLVELFQRAHADIAVIAAAEQRRDLGRVVYQPGNLQRALPSRRGLDGDPFAGDDSHFFLR